MAGTDDMISSFFYANPTGEGMTYEQLKARRAMAAALASKARDYPNTVGKGIFSLGESIGETIRDRKMDAEEKRIRAGDEKANEELRKLNPSYAPIPVPPVAPPGPAAAPPPSAGTLPTTAEVTADPDISRAQMAEALLGGAQGSRPAAPAGPRMASLPSAGTMSDAGQPGLTYGGPQPAGPGASMAEPPDLNPPAPSAPPPMPMPGPGATDTPPPAPGTGGGVPPVMAGAAGPQPAVPREMLAQVAMANQGANPDAAGPVPPGGGVPPQMLAQVGGFGGAPDPAAAGPPPGPGGAAPPGAGTGLPAFPPSVTTAPPGPGGVRPGATPHFMPMSEGEATRRFGAPGKPPEQWDPDLHGRYRRALEMSQDPNRSTEFRKKAAETADLIEKANAARYTQGQERHKAQETRRQGQVDDVNKRMWEEQLKADDPIEQGKRRTAAREERIATKSGLPAERLYKQMDTELDSARVTASRQEDNKIVLDALKSGLPITGAWAEPRLDAARFGAWVLNNPQLAARAGSTELLRAKLLNGVSGAIKDLKPISNVEVQLGQKMVGDISQQPEVLKTLVEQSIGRNNRELAKYDTRAHRFFSGEGEIAETYKSPEATWFNPKHLQVLFTEAPRDPGVIAEFNSRYGPGSAEFALNRKRLNPAAR
jgi:hypothetical protein